ncbi:trypco2 family protein [Streptomyces niveus]|uniref:trypco2 family protein n=1 Tax=Streptomyces niveus TaxID=193462 RepID=UPI0036F14291
MDDRVAAGLAETIRALRTELTDAMESGHDEALRFELGAVTLEVTLAITNEVSGDGGVRFGVVSFGAKGKIGDDVTHRLSLSLSPVVDDDGQTRPARINARADREPR